MKPHENKKQSAASEPKTARRADTQKERVSRFESGTIIFLAIVITLAFVLRMIYLLQLRNSPLFDAPQMDALYHDQWAQAIAKGEAFIEGPYFRAPLYPFFLSAIYKIFGHGYLIPRAIQALLGSFSCGLVFLIGRRMFSQKVGVLAGIAAAMYWVLIYFDSELLIPALIVFLDLLMILLLFHANAKPGKLSFGLAGLVLGLSAIARPNVLLFAPAVIIWLAVMHRPAWKRVVIWACCFALGCLLPILPVTTRNYVVGKDLVLIASQGGVNFYIGNNPDSDGTTAIVPGTPGDWWGGYHASIARAEQAEGRSLKPSEVSRYYYRQAMEFWSHQPTQALNLTLRKLWLFWNGKEISNNKDLYFWTERFTPVVKFLPLNFMIVGPLGLLGIILCWRRKGELFPLWGFVLIYMVSIIMFFCTARYRCPIIGPLMLLGANAIFYFLAAVRQFHWRRIVGCLIVLLPAALFVNAVSLPPDPTKGAQSLGLLAKAYAQKDRLDLAVKHYYEAAEADPQSLSARYDLGTVLLKSGKISEAVEQLQHALDLTSNLRWYETEANVARVHHNLANALRMRGDRDAALGHYRQAIDLHPDGGEALFYLNLGSTLLELEQSSEAVEALEHAVTLDPELQESHYWLAVGYARLDKLDKAEEHMREVLSINSQNWRACHGLGRILIAQDRLDEAINALRRTVRIQPDNMQAVQDLGSVLAEEARYAEALEVLDTPIALKDRGVLNDLIWLLATCPTDDIRNGARAIDLATKLCPDKETCAPNFLDTMAAAFAEAGRYAEAASIAHIAIQRARAAGEDTLAQSIADRLRLYERGKPYHESSIDR